MKIHMKTTVKERWEAVMREYTQKGSYAQTDLRAKFLAMKCPEKGNPREFLEGEEGEEGGAGTGGCDDQQR